MDTEARILLDDTIEFCRRDGRDGRLISMLEQIVPTGMDDESLTIEAPSRFACSYLSKQQRLIEDYLEQITFAPMRLVVLPPQGAGAAPATAERESAAAPQEPDAPAQAPADAPGARTAETGRIDPDSRSAAASGPQLAAPHRAQTATGVNVTNTLSADAFRQMMAEMKGEADPAQQAAPAPEPDPLEEQPAVGVNSKFTFENFVFGDENKHAYQSAVRFAAMADEPGQCTSLFIYGSSGLGKTHLLFAIQNYLAAEKPFLRVKYANSGDYIDDYMAALSLQKERSGSQRIMSAYRDADILIIDDIQNIIGRSASIEFFFQLVDEFIRTGKKIAIASDRAPKKLGLDERLTSRFNAGMLCLVSEPGFEMKYAVLKNYHEKIIRSERTAPVPGAAPSILEANRELHESHLSDDQLKHMAEISGNNIRELESFCERCAALSYEREQAGRELSVEDIDRVADEYFDTAHKTVAADTILSVVEEYYHVSHADIISRKQSKDIAFSRHVAVYLINIMCEMSTTAVGKLVGRDHSTVLNSIKVIEKRKSNEAGFGEELERLKNIILLKS